MNYQCQSEDLKKMISSFRVQELQSLLLSYDKSKSGRKQELLMRANQLSHEMQGDPEFTRQVKDLYAKRNPTIQNPAAMLKQASGSRTSSRSKGNTLPQEYIDAINYNPENNHRMDTYITNPHQQVTTQGMYQAAPQRHRHQQEIPQHLSPQHQMQDPLIKFKPLPFFDLYKVLIEPTKLLIPDRTTNQTANGKLKLSFMIDSNLPVEPKSMKSRLQVQLRFKLLNPSSKTPERLPPNIFVKLNERVVQLPNLAPQTKAGDEPRYFNRPVNLTTFCNKNIKNKLNIKWNQNSPEKYAYCVHVVKPQTVDDLFNKLLQRGKRPALEAKQDIINKMQQDAESDVSTLSLEVSVICPLGKCRMQTPARPRSCTHLQCFDVRTFLMMNANRPSWMCPVCHKEAQFTDLQIDGYFSEIIEKSKEDEIEFNKDGSWKPKGKEVPQQVQHRIENVLDLSSFENVGKCEPNDDQKQEEVIDLTNDTTDDEDDNCNTAMNNASLDDPINALLSSSPNNDQFPPSQQITQQQHQQESRMRSPSDALRFPQQSQPYYASRNSPKIPSRHREERSYNRYSPMTTSSRHGYSRTSSVTNHSTSSAAALETPPTPNHHNNNDLLIPVITEEGNGPNQIPTVVTPSNNPIEEIFSEGNFDQGSSSGRIGYPATQQQQQAQLQPNFLQLQQQAFQNTLLGNSFGFGNQAASFAAAAAAPQFGGFAAAQPQGNVPNMGGTSPSRFFNDFFQ